MNNPFPYSFDNKRYHTFNYYLKNTYHQKTAKVMLDGGFSCPNRDGTKGYGGCTFCSLKGSGDANLYTGRKIVEQFAENKMIMQRKWPDCLLIPYFQSFSNTYGPLSKIKEITEPFLSMANVPAITYATRCDCLSEDVIVYLDSLTDKKDIWLELGLQTSNDHTAQIINRGHSFNEFLETMNRLKSTKIKTCIHIINGLKGEDKSDMVKTISDISHLSFNAIKIHMLHIVKNTKIADEYLENPWPLLSMDEYIDIVISQLEMLPPEIIIERLTGDPVQSDLIAPAWTTKKIDVLNGIDKKMAKMNTYQGKYYAHNNI